MACSSLCEKLVPNLLMWTSVDLSFRRSDQHRVQIPNPSKIQSMFHPGRFRKSTRIKPRACLPLLIFHTNFMPLAKIHNKPFHAEQNQQHATWCSAAVLRPRTTSSRLNVLFLSAPRPGLRRQNSNLFATLSWFQETEPGLINGLSDCLPRKKTRHWCCIVRSSLSSLKLLISFLRSKSCELLEWWAAQSKWRHLRWDHKKMIEDTMRPSGLLPAVGYQKF